MTSASRWIFLALVILAGVFAGRWLGRSATESGNAPSATSADRTRTLSGREKPFTRELREREEGSYRADHQAMNAGALPNQRTLRFANRAALEAFLRSIEGKGLVVLGSIDALNMLRVGFLDQAELAKLVGDDTQQEFIFPANIPGSGTIQDGAIGFGSNFLDWLGVPSDRNGWGEGLKIAVLDTGMGSNSQFNNRIIQNDLVERSPNASDLNGHGTAVASIIASELGLAPDATILSYRVADDNGSSNTFVLAQAIIEATDAGVDLINISLGSRSHSPTLQAAVDYASEAGVVVVASTGNDGYQSVSYPAAYNNVVGVGAVDANGQHLEFSNSGEVNLTAPGLALTSAWTDEQLVNFTGTSASAPVVTGAIAATMSNLGVNASSALEILTAQANDGGAPGYDPAYGSGFVDVGRALRPNGSDYTDVAIASNHFTTNSQGAPVVQVTVQNRGTTQIINAPVTVSTPGGTSRMNVTSLRPGDIQTFEVLLSGNGQENQVQSSVQISNGDADQNVSNNARTDVQPAADNP